MQQGAYVFTLLTGKLGVNTNCVDTQQRDTPLAPLSNSTLMITHSRTSCTSLAGLKEKRKRERICTDPETTPIRF